MNGNLDIKQECIRIFLQEAGITDATRFEGMELPAIAQRLFAAAEITPERLKLDEERLSSLVARATQDTGAARILGKAANPALLEASLEGRIRLFDGATKEEARKAQKAESARKRLQHESPEKRAQRLEKKLLKRREKDTPEQRRIHAEKAKAHYHAAIKPERDEMTAEQQAEELCRKKAEQKTWIEEFYAACGLWKKPDTDGIERREYDHSIITNLIRQFRQDTELFDTTALYEHLPGGAGRTAFENRLFGKVEIDRSFFEHCMGIIAPKVKEGVEQGWLNPLNGKPMSFEVILYNRLGWPAARLEGRTGKDALLFAMEECKKASGLPSYALGPLVEKDTSYMFIRKKANTAYTFPPSMVARIADALKPYFPHHDISGTEIEGKKWNGILEVTGGEWLEKHRIVRDYFTSEVIRRVTEKALATAPHIGETEAASLAQAKVGEIERALASLPDQPWQLPVETLTQTTGPALKLLREAVQLGPAQLREKLEANGTRIERTTLSELEANCFDPGHFAGTRTGHQTLRREIESCAEVIANEWLGIRQQKDRARGRDEPSP